MSTFSYPPNNIRLRIGNNCVWAIANTKKRFRAKKCGRKNRPQIKSGLCAARLLLDHYTEAGALIVEIAVNAHSSGGAAFRSDVLPGASSLNAQGAGRGALWVSHSSAAAIVSIIIQTQFSEIAVHVENAPVVDEILARFHKIVALAIVGIVSVSSHFRHVRANRGIGQILSAVQSGGSCRSASIFPLRFGRQEFLFPDVLFPALRQRSRQRLNTRIRRLLR